MWSAQATAEGLTLLVADNKTGYFGVKLDQTGRPLPKPYEARVKRGGKNVNLGSFATAEARGGGAVHRANAGGAGGGAEGCSGATADERGGTAAGAGGGADAARGR